ncbi:2367_t:CDS:2, partial [Paraglomus occultum]
MSTTDLPPLRIATFNIRFDGQSGLLSNQIKEQYVQSPIGTNQETPWRIRRPKVADTITFHKVDVVGFQEALYNQVQDFEYLFGSNWGWTGVGRDDGKKKGEFVPIFYNKNRLQLLESTSWWLSETPDVPGSIGWDAGLPRVVTQAKFLDRLTNKTFHHINTHFDDRGEKARDESARLILNRTQELNLTTHEAIILTGDFNVEEDSSCYKTLVGKQNSSDHEKDKFIFSDTRYDLSHDGTKSFGHQYTFTGFSSSEPLKRIDFVMIDSTSVGKSRVRTVNHGVIPNRFDDGMYISDHRAVVADL